MLFALANSKFIFINAKVFFTRNVIPQSTSAEVPEAPLLTSPDVLLIPSLSITAPIKYIEKKGEVVYQAALAEGVVHYPGTALPGELGNVYIFGHSSDVVWSRGAYKTVFASLTQIKNGELIYVTDHTGQQYVYEVVETKVVAPNDLSVVSQFEKKEKYLSLQTSYPLGTALKRFVVLAKLLED